LLDFGYITSSIKMDLPKIQNIVLKYPVYFEELAKEYDQMKVGRPYTVQTMIEDLYWKACREKIENDESLSQLLKNCSLDDRKPVYSVYDSSFCALS